jgi:hypothetical protein
MEMELMGCRRGRTGEFGCGFAGVVLILLLLDPRRPAPVLVLLAIAVACAVVPSFLRR